MKHISWLILLVCTSSFAHHDKISPPVTIKIMGKTLEIKENSFHHGDLIVTYLPAGQTMENWTTRFRVRFSEDYKQDTKGKVLAVAKMVAQKKQKGDRAAKFKNLTGKYSKWSMADFVVSDDNCTEHNVIKFLNTKSGALSYQLSRRIYKDSYSSRGVLKEFFDYVENGRKANVKLLNGSNLPLASLQKN